MNSKRLLLTLITGLFMYVNLTGQSEINQLVKDFTGDDWPTVRKAKESLENYEGVAVPKILALLKNTSIVKLTNTGSLIYPGAEKSYGYGQMVDYDIDNIAVRAGWLLEELSFNNFGFTGIRMYDEDLIGFIKLTFPDYYNNSNNRKKLESSSVDVIRNIIKQMSIDNAEEWWKNESKTWNRLDALEEALKSFDEKRQVKALFYMRNGTTCCTGLTSDFFIDNLSREIFRLSLSNTQRVSEHAKLILTDDKFSWLEIKSQK